jgi:hypothetical protein
VLQERVLATYCKCHQRRQIVPTAHDQHEPDDQRFVPKKLLDAAYNLYCLVRLCYLESLAPLEYTSKGRGKVR